MTNTRDKEELYIIIKASIEENIKIINIYAPNIGPAQCIRQMLTAIKREINSNTIIVGDFNNPLSSTDASSRQNINRKTQALNDTLEHMVLIDIYPFQGRQGSPVAQTLMKPPAVQETRV